MKLRSNLKIDDMAQIGQRKEDQIQEEVGEDKKIKESKKEMDINKLFQILMVEIGEKVNKK